MDSCVYSLPGWSIQPVRRVGSSCWKPDSPDPASRELTSIPPPAPILPCPLPGVCSSLLRWASFEWVGELGWQRDGAGPEVPGEPRGEGSGEGGQSFVPPGGRKDIPGPCFSNLLCSLLFVFFPST